MKDSTLGRLRDAIWDRELYGRSFFFESLWYLIFGLLIQYVSYFLLAPAWLIVYVPLFLVAIILISTVLTKNYREFHPMDRWLAYLLLFTSSLSKVFAVLIFLTTTVLFFLQFMLVLFVCEPAFLSSLIMIVVLSQRDSIHNEVGLPNNFFKREKTRWEKEHRAFQIANYKS
jgi:signal transduction histidine kinase